MVKALLVAVRADRLERSRVPRVAAARNFYREKGR